MGRVDARHWRVVAAVRPISAHSCREHGRRIQSIQRAHGWAHRVLGHRLGVLFVLYWPHPKTGVRAQLSFGLMIAGMIGNLVDRVVFGHVIDFINIVPWFIFNAADASILLGIVFFACDVPSGRMFSKPRL